MKIINFTPENKKLTRRLVKFAEKLYKNDSNWVPPLKMELLGNRLLGAKGILRKNHPFHQHAEVQYFMVVLGKKKIAGTIAACVNHIYNDYHHEKTGFFGFFETIEDYRVAEELLNAAKGWLKEKGMQTMRGPANFSSNETLGLLVSGFDTLTTMGTTYNKPYYLDFLERFGCTKSMDLIAQTLPIRIEGEEGEKRNLKLKNFTEKIKERNKIRIENFNSKKPEEHLKIIKELYHEAWKDNWGFVPLSDAEFAILAENLKMAADPKLIKIAYVEDEPAAFIGTLPDINEIFSQTKRWPELFTLIRILFRLKRKKFTRTRLLLFGIQEKFRKLGLDGVLFFEEFASAREEGRIYNFCEISWLLETNSLILHAGERLKAVEYKRWRLFDLPL
ncbi:MAG TPA: hypothetical protein DHW82_12615 [Spirochaetia bacterium]|nr:MAG: hypothetical protein A2Y41_04085 [Spirochaetes bacterium GWB1_36_13]HCL57832.1 hypothetical protein [Spirochaetia bacterium]